jgi:hypothetical protein
MYRPASAAHSAPAIASCRACWWARSARSPRRRFGRGRASAGSAFDAVALGLRPRRRAGPRGMAVHQHLAGETRRMPRAAAASNRASARGLVHGREHHRRGGAVGQQRVEEARGAPPRPFAGSASAVRPGRCRSPASPAARCRSWRSRPAAAQCTWVSMKPGSSSRPRWSSRRQSGPGSSWPGRTSTMRPAMRPPPPPAGSAASGPGASAHRAWSARPRRAPR